MASASPSEFLTFYRRLASPSTLRNGAVACRRVQARPFSSTIARTADTKNPHLVSDKGTHQDTSPGKKEHVLSKGLKGDTNVQSDASYQARSDKAQDAGGSATRQKDERNSTARAKKEFPEAPDVVIGMQDERGGKGM